MRCGPTNQIYNLIKYLDRNIYHPVIVTLSPEPNDSMWQNFEAMDVELYTLGLSRIKGLVFGVPTLKKILDELQVDIVHTQGIRADTIAAKYLHNYRTVATLRNFPFCDNVMKYGKLRGHLISLHHLQMLRRIDSPVAVSNSLAKMLAEKSNFTIEVIQNGVDMEIFHPVVNYAYKRQLRRKLNIALSKMTFISTGLIHPLKDPLTIIRAFRDKFIEQKCHVIFLGDGPLMASCKDCIRGAEHIKFYGNITNMCEYLQASDFFISAAQTEGLPNAVLEAMACGLPCVLSDIEAHREIIKYNHKSGKLFKTKDINGLANKINEIIEDNYKDMSRCALNVITNHLSDEIMSKKYQQLYEKIFEDN